MLLARMLGRRRQVSEDLDTDPPVLTTDPRLPVHILRDDAQLRVEDGNAIVESDGQERILRLAEVSLIALHGGASVTAPCLGLFAEHGVPLALFSRSGRYQGQLADLSGQQAAIRRAHYRAADDPQAALAIARRLVCAKLHSGRYLLRRRLGASDDAVRLLRRQEKRAATARSLKSLLGVEGAGAAAYWRAWPNILREESEMFTFSGRSRRPPRDAVNALLSYLYAVVTGNCAAVALAAGLDPVVGFLHAERPGRPSLALDLVEPLRTAVVDAAIVAAVNRREFDGEHFNFDGEQGVRLSDAGRRLALEILERRMSTEIMYAGAGMTWRAAVSRYVVDLAAFLRKGGRLPEPPRLG